MKLNIEVPMVKFTNNTNISAIYYALLQSGYEFHVTEKDASLIKELETHIQPNGDSLFFSQARQTMCKVYPFWPRATILEQASFYIDKNQNHYRNFGVLQAKINSADNISDAERSEEFWLWLEDFPPSLQKVLESIHFNEYLSWEKQWIEKQKIKYTTEITKIQELLSLCSVLYKTSFSNVDILINPIKCAYSADYHVFEKKFIFSSGAFNSSSVIHEFLHLVANPVITKNKSHILDNRIEVIDVDVSYYLDGTEKGTLNAIEEHFVRKLTNELTKGFPPKDLDLFLKELLK